MKRNKSLIIADAVCGIIMLVSVLVYLILGLTINFWHPGWMIIVGAVIVSGIISIIFNARANLKDEKQEEEPKKFKDL